MINDQDLPSLKRRNVLGTLGIGTLVSWFGTAPASAFFFKTKGSSVSLEGLPSQWVALQGRNLPDYAQYLAGLRLRNVTPRQVIEAHAKRKGSVWNTLPPKRLWKNLVPTLKALDKVADQVGRPVSEVVSAYRSPAYNARCAGAKRGSWHQANVALDVKFPVRPSTVASTARSLRSRGLFRGGVGRYYSFTHIDTRGQNADW